MDRTYDRKLDCGCWISSDGGGGLVPCSYGYGCGKKGCDEFRHCDDCKEQDRKHERAWSAWIKSPDYKLHLKEVNERNQ